jgi:hypothetical protein
MQDFQKLTFLTCWRFRLKERSQNRKKLLLVSSRLSISRSIRLSAWDNSAPNGLNFMIFYCAFFKNL